MCAGTDKLVEQFGGRAEPSVNYAHHVLPFEGRDFPALSYRPSAQNPDIPILVSFHYGGGIVGSFETSPAFCVIFAKSIAGSVLSVDNRLAPERPWPADLNDAIEALI
ncbi:hypothetical protein PsB1_0461 [Candidatus Phycosocius spiralis]|uniref:Alpha/beta hydrolase fold-3 domain-containing protein n=2 Tax=Candidatus Phycosocius spiralis TaxID=2815099 RepID=A0ABQ4PTG3_9PROT|nr:hypothetical protein PsB1_0461 [Candidatus Phycosocius spiralis]